MTEIVLIALAFAFLGIAMAIISQRIKGGSVNKPKPLYHYRRKQYVMTKAEHECFDLLNQTLGDQYYVFPQIHLPTILDNKVTGQNWNAAFRHVNQKSVDFVLCDKISISPVLAIELDDATHERDDRRTRDEEVENIFAGADVPLLRLKGEVTSAAEISQAVKKLVGIKDLV